MEGYSSVISKEKILLAEKKTYISTHRYDNMLNIGLHVFHFMFFYFYNTLQHYNLQDKVLNCLWSISGSLPRTKCNCNYILLKP